MRIVKYLVADDNLYVVMQHSQQSIKGLLRSQRIIHAGTGSNGIPNYSAPVSDAFTRSLLMEPWEAAEHMKMVQKKENSLATRIVSITEFTCFYNIVLILSHMACPIYF